MSIHVAVSPSVFDRKVLPFDPPEFPQSLDERFSAWCGKLGIRIIEESNARMSRQGLRTRDTRCGEEANKS
ncbi:MAG TPA: hypothetical protein VKG21_08045 [Casimicrobiaceae bacterium]|nr:hypothetical protein [Casimicrobiaceae bacterium]